MLKVFLTGRVVVDTDGVVIDERGLPGRQGRLLFGCLVWEDGRAVPLGELAEALWGEEPPARWEKALSVLVSKLRVLLGGIGIDGAISLTGAFGCYRLELPEGSWVDVLTAASAVHEAEEALAAGELERAKASAGLAESLVRQPFLPGDDGTWIEAKRRELAEVRARAVSVLADASLRTGVGREAARWAEQAIALEPFRESGYRRLMQAQIAAGDRAEALRTYDRCRRLLADELGTYPSPETESIYRALLEPPFPPARTARSQAPPAQTGGQEGAAVGLELGMLGLDPSPRLQLDAAILAHDPSVELQANRAILRHDPSLLTAPAAGAPAPAASHLPVPATPFLGRARELAEVTALLRGAAGRLLTLTGAGGSGKTRLALQVAHECAEDHRGGVWFVAFAGITDPELSAPTICEAIGLVDQPGLTATQRLEGYLRDREVLLVLDNLEQLTPEVVGLSELLARCPGVRMLVTSREPLHLAAEQQYQVPLLAREDALELFTARARVVAPSVIIERDTVGAVCEQLDRLPLAIELAAARTKVLSPAQILARLEGHLPVLATGPHDAPERQRTLRATIDWSYDLLTDEEQRLFTRLSVFARGSTLDGAEAVCDARVDTLEGLVDQSLLCSGGGRYWMLQTLREYALDKLVRSAEEDDVRRRHAQWFVELLASHGLDKSADVDTGRLRELLKEERENFRAALEWSERAGEVETVARLAAPLTRLWREEGSLSEADRWIDVARARSTEYPLPLQALVLSAARELAWARGAHHEWADLCEQALVVYRELGDVAGIIRAIDMRAAATAEQGDLPGARVMTEEAAQLAREHEDTGWLPRILGNLADMAIADGKLDQARVLCEEALSPGARASPTTEVVAMLQLNLAYIANLERRHADAAELAQEALSGALAAGILHGAAAAAVCLAWSLAERRQPERAARLLGAAAEFFRHTGTAMQWSETAAEHAARDALDRQLDARTLNALLDEGRTMTIEQAALIAGRLTTTPDRLPRHPHRLRSV